MKTTFLSCALLLGVIACGGSSEETDSDRANQTQNEDNPSSPEGNDGDAPEGESPGTESPGSESPGGEPNDPDSTPIDVTPLNPGTPSPSAEPGAPPSSGDDPPDPDPNADPCEGKTCGESCGPSGAQLLIAGPLPPSYCDATGACAAGVPICENEAEENECTELCDVPTICALCDDGETCAEADVACNPDGSCGDITWMCPEDEEPEAIDCWELCGVDDVCQMCEDGSCAAATPTCSADGSCGPTEYSCPGDEGNQCEVDADCPATRIACAQCGDGSSSCPRLGCVEGQCVVSTPTCPDDYDPCAGKEDGDSCTVCPPNDPACTETDEIKACQKGQCLPLLEAQ